MKKAFTLIELLAVIILLGVITLIAIPIVNNIIMESREGTFKSTVLNLDKAINQDCSTRKMKEETLITTYIIKNGVITPEVSIKGEIPNGEVTVNSSCETILSLSNSLFNAKKSSYEGEITITRK